MKKKLLLFIASFSFVTSSVAQLEITKNINKISTDTLNQIATRPLKTGFILDKAINELGYNPYSFEECLTIIENQLKNK